MFLLSFRQFYLLSRFGPFIPLLKTKNIQMSRFGKFRGWPLSYQIMNYLHNLTMKILLSFVRWGGAQWDDFGHFLTSLCYSIYGRGLVWGKYGLNLRIGFCSWGPSGPIPISFFLRLECGFISGCVNLFFCRKKCGAQWDTYCFRMARQILCIFMVETKKGEFKKNTSR